MQAGAHDAQRSVCSDCNLQAVMNYCVTLDKKGQENTPLTITVLCIQMALRIFSVLSVHDLYANGTETERVLAVFSVQYVCAW